MSKSIISLKNKLLSKISDNKVYLMLLIFVIACILSWKSSSRIFDYPYFFFFSLFLTLFILTLLFNINKILEIYNSETKNKLFETIVKKFHLIYYPVTIVFYLMAVFNYYMMIMILDNDKIENKTGTYKIEYISKFDTYGKGRSEHYIEVNTEKFGNSINFGKSYYEYWEQSEKTLNINYNKLGVNYKNGYFGTILIKDFYLIERGK